MSLEELASTDGLPAKVRRVFREARELYSGELIDAAVDRMAVELTVRYQDRNPVLAVLLPDGLCLAGMLLRRMIFPLQLCCAERPTHWPEIVQKRIVIAVLGDAREASLRETVAESLRAQGAQDVAAVALVGATEDAATLTVVSGLEDELFGAGLDVSGYGRNLAGLYAIGQADEQDA